ncbi:MAG: ATP-binding protein [Cyanobacteria bacterium P01_E01_bin.42]
MMNVSGVANANLPLPRLDDLLERDVVTFSADLPLPQVLERLGKMAATNGKGISSRRVAIVEAERPIGTLATEDLLAGWLENGTIADIPVREVMTPHPIVFAEAELRDPFAAMELMGQHHLEELLAIDERGKLCGIITQARILKTLPFSELRQTVQAFTDEIERLKNENQRLVTICAPYLDVPIEWRDGEIPGSSFKTLLDIKYALDLAAIVAITDPQGVIIEVNDRFCEISEYRREEILGQTHKIINSGYHPPVFFAGMWKTIQAGRVWRGEIKNRAKSGREYWVNTTIVPFFSKTGELFQYLAIRTDITEQKKAEANVAQLLEREKELNELKTRFITTVSHEFRTPLSLISASTGILQDYGDRLAEEKKGKHLHRIQNAVVQMTELMEDILTVDRATTDLLLFEPASVNLIDFCTTLQADFCRRYPQRKIDWRVNSVMPISPEIQADSNLLQQIFSNLLSNALKYSPEHRPVDWDLSYRSDKVVFQVRDRGIGIPSGDLKCLFASFHRADNVGTIKGAGLGLAIVKKCVDLHCGKIAVESIENAGTTVTVEFPLTLVGENNSHD